MTRRAALALLALAAAAACAPVAPYQRGHLARPDMGLEGSPGARALDKGFSFKEAAHGGSSVGGGGCGCS